MSITIKHLDGPLKGDPTKGEVSFGDETSSILIGRAAEAEISYPEECIAVDGEHLRLNRDADGGYTIELPGSCDVAIDGKPAETGDPVTSGSVVTVGEGGPRFDVRLPGADHRHLAGPLAGSSSSFPSYGVRSSLRAAAGANRRGLPGRLHQGGPAPFQPEEDRAAALIASSLRRKHYVEIDGEAANERGVGRIPQAISVSPATKGPTFEAWPTRQRSKASSPRVNYEPPSEFKLIKQLQARGGGAVRRAARRRLVVLLSGLAAQAGRARAGGRLGGRRREAAKIAANKIQKSAQEARKGRLSRRENKGDNRIGRPRPGRSGPTRSRPTPMSPSRSKTS